MRRPSRTADGRPDHAGADGGPDPGTHDHHDQPTAGGRPDPGIHGRPDHDPSVDEAPLDEADDERQLWCDTCEASVPIGDLDEDDCCPTCGEPIGGRRIPWKFRLMIFASVVYLGYRAFQGITWVVHHV